jgi:hypothetical protein
VRRSWWIGGLCSASMTVLIRSGRCREEASGVRGAVSGEDVFASHANNHLTTDNSPYSMPPYSRARDLESSSGADGAGR